MLKRHKLVLASLALLTALGSSSCYGTFNATRSLYKWNGGVDEKWGNEAVFLGLAILPVYGIFMLGDALIFNTIEFWGGKNPVDAPTAQADERPPEQGDGAVQVAGNAPTVGGETGGF